MTRYERNGGQSRGWRPEPDPPGYAGRRGKGNSLIWVGVFALMAVWTMLCLLGYLTADPLIAWLKAATLGVVDNGQGLAEAVGGKVAGETMQVIKSSGIVGQTLGILEMIAKPAIAAVWFLGLVILAVLPVVASRVLRIISGAAR